MTSENQGDAQQHQATWNMLSAAHTAYSAKTTVFYDEILGEVSTRIESAESIGKSDIGSLLMWKRLRADTPWAKKLMNMPESEVRTATGKSFHAVNDQTLSVPEAASAGRGELSVLPGFRTGDALASALLLAAAPNRMAVYDRRAQNGLKNLNIPLTSHRGRYGHYMEIVEKLRSLANQNGHQWLARDVDLALYWLGGPKA